MSNKFTWYFDFISPFAYIQYTLLKKDYVDIEIEPVPVLFGALLQNHQHKGPAEIPTKRTVTYRYCVWLAHKNGIPFRFPKVHPFKPLGPLRLCIVAGETSDVIDEIFRTIWVDGQDLSNPDKLENLSVKLGYPDHHKRIQADSVKAKLKTNTEMAIAQGVFGVPTLAQNGQLFWGVDMLEMANEYNSNPGFLSDPEFSALEEITDGLNL